MDGADYTLARAVLDRAEALTRKTIGERVARHTAELAKNNGLASNRRWFAEIDIYEDELRSFLSNCTAEIGKHTRTPEAFSLIAERFEALQRDSKHKLTERFNNADKASPMPSASRALPPAKRESDERLKAELTMQRELFMAQNPKQPGDAQPAEGTPVRNKGGKPLAAHWDAMWAHIAVQLYTLELQPDTQADIERAMADWFEDANSNGGEKIDPGVTAIRQRARALWKVYQPVKQ
jgi:hypothetical protein